MESDHPARVRRTALATAALALAALAPSAATAAPITVTSPAYHASTPLAPTSASSGGSAEVATSPLSVPKFDPALGTLKAVTLTLGYTLENDFRMNFVAPSTMTVSATTAKVQVDRPNQTALLSASPADVSKTETVTGAPFPHALSLPSLTRTGSTGPLSLTSAADLAMFTAAKKGDTLTLPAIASSRSVVTSTTGNADGRVDTRAGVDLTVTYTYAPVPEPTGLAVLGLGALGWLAARKNRAA